MAKLKKVLGADEIILVAALLLVTIGLWLVAGQASLIAPGFVLLWVGLPSRSPFVMRPGFQKLQKNEK